MVAVLVAVIGSATALTSILLQAKVHRDNRSDHGTVAEKLDQLVADVSDLRLDVGDLKHQYLILREASRPTANPSPEGVTA